MQETLVQFLGRFPVRKDVCYRNFSHKKKKTLNDLLKVMCAVLSPSVVSDSLQPMDCSLEGSSVHGVSAG